MKIRDALTNFNRDYLASRRDRLETAWNVASIVIILAGLLLAAWAWRG